MRTIKELIEATKVFIEEDDYDSIVEIVCEALKHLPDIRTPEFDRWEEKAVASCCHDIGNLIFEHTGIRGLRFVMEGVNYRLNFVIAKRLSQFWDGCGEGAWQSQS